MILTYEEGSGFSAFAIFNAIKLHFTSDSYDFFRYNGKSNVTKQNFANRKDKYSFYKLSRKYRNEELMNFYIANFLVKDVNWIGDITGVEGEENYKMWQKRNQSLNYRFKEDIMYLMDKVSIGSDMIKVKDGQYPLLLNETMQGAVTIETLSILNHMMGFFEMWNKKISDTIIWPTWKRKCEKYAPFIHYDESKYKETFKEAIKEYA
jgi:hypothetical protein